MMKKQIELPNFLQSRTRLDGSGSILERKGRLLLVFSLLFMLVLPACSAAVAEPPEPTAISPTATAEVALSITPTASEVADMTATPAVLVTDQDLVVSQCEALATAFNQKMAADSGWVREVSETVYFNNVSDEYEDSLRHENWYRFDAGGYVLEGYGWMGTLDGVIQQESVWLNGWYDGVYRNSGYNLEYDFGPEGEIQRTHTVAEEPRDFSAGFCATLADKETAQMSVVDYHDQEAWQFSYEGQADAEKLISAIYFDRDTGYLFGMDTHLVQPDGSLKIVSGTIYTEFEFHAYPPEERFAEIWARVPHGEEFVPVEQGD